MIRIGSLWKSYPIEKDRPGFKEFILNAGEFMKQSRNTFWALKDINLEIKKGECVGVIGRNGAGKSTLLSILLGTTYPTKGGVKVSGKRTPLLELGAGFHNDMTGRENIIFNGILLGLTRKDVEKRMDGIIAFSELEEFIDRPIRTYSSGMYMRLAFSVAIHTDPEIMLIDEILSVGDEFFQKKSREAITGLIGRGITTVFVSHDMESVKAVCGRAVWLEHGGIAADGETAAIVDKYQGAKQ